VKFTGKRSFPLAGMDKKQAGGKGGDSRGNPTLIKVENQTPKRKYFKLKKMLQPKRTKYRGTKKGKMKGTLEEGMNF
jgi:hypothetical protein